VAIGVVEVERLLIILWLETFLIVPVEVLNVLGVVIEVGDLLVTLELRTWLFSGVVEYRLLSFCY